VSSTAPRPGSQLSWVLLAVRHGVDDALQSNRLWMTAPDRDRVER
jgi:hypothetical protein